MVPLSAATAKATPGTPYASFVCRRNVLLDGQEINTCVNGEEKSFTGVEPSAFAIYPLTPPLVGKRYTKLLLSGDGARSTMPSGKKCILLLDVAVFVRLIENVFIVLPSAYCPTT
jgi:hypothetical protein